MFQNYTDDHISRLTVANQFYTIANPAKTAGQIVKNFYRVGGSDGAIFNHITGSGTSNQWSGWGVVLQEADLQGECILSWDMSVIGKANWSMIIPFIAKQQGSHSELEIEDDNVKDRKKKEIQFGKAGIDQEFYMCTPIHYHSDGSRISMGSKGKIVVDTRLLSAATGNDQIGFYAGIAVQHGGSSTFAAYSSVQARLHTEEIETFNPSK